MLLNENLIDNLKLRTEIERLSFPFTLGIESRVLCIGSCFAQVIGDYLDIYKIINNTNPFGVLFNPISIAQNLLDSINNIKPSADLYAQKEGNYVHFNYHSDLSSKHKDDVAGIISKVNVETKKALIAADVLILTFGTAWVHVLNEKKQVVANCHKQQPDRFSKKLIAENEFEVVFERLLKKLKEINPKLHVLLSVSPVIHEKEGLVGNSISKSTLVYLAQRLTTSYDNVSYFPAYEIVKEDLRDYRFYKEDLIHPNKQAEQYILDYFFNHVGSEELKNHLSKYKKIVNNINHRPFNEKSQPYLNHLQKTLFEINSYPFKVDLTKEKVLVSEKIVEIQKALEP